MAKKNLPGPNADGVNKPPGEKGDISKLPSTKRNKVGDLKKIPSTHTNKKGNFQKLPSTHTNKKGNIQKTPSTHTNKVGDIQKTPSTHTNKVGDIQKLPSTHTNKVGDIQKLPSTHINKVGEFTKLPSTHTNKVGEFLKLPNTHINKIGDLASLNPPTDQGDYNIWPLPKFSFWVDIGGFDGKVAFQGMDGLGASVGKMEFRDGNSSKFHKESRPTLTTFDPCTLKKGMFEGDKKLFNWFTNVSTGAIFSDLRTVSITLCKLEGGKQIDIFTWTLEKAYVTKYTPTNMDGEADSEPAIEEVELTYQSFSTSI